MEKLNRDILIYMSRFMDLPDILSLCEVSTGFNQYICTLPLFWIERLKQDFNINYYEVNPKDIFINNPKDLYIIAKDDFIKMEELDNYNVKDLYDYIVRLRGISDNTKRHIAVEMYKQSENYDPNMVLKDNLYLVDDYSEQENHRSIYLVEDPEQLIPDSIQPVIQFDIDNGAYNNISFEEYHGKSRKEYLEEIRKELETLKTRNTYFLKNTAFISIPSPLGREWYTVSRIK